MKPHYEEAVRDALENSFGESDAKNFMLFLVETARNAVEDNYTDYLEELLDSRRDSFLEELDEFNVDVYFKDLLRNSVGYMLLERCGFDGEEYFDIEDFREIANFSPGCPVFGRAIYTNSHLVISPSLCYIISTKEKVSPQRYRFSSESFI